MVVIGVGVGEFELGAPVLEEALVGARAAAGGEAREFGCEEGAALVWGAGGPRVFGVEGGGEFVVEAGAAVAAEEEEEGDGEDEEEEKEAGDASGEGGREERVVPV